ncbi:hypothetical protein PG984_010486 [Apiospora sp. TS-2023a]
MADTTDDVKDPFQRQLIVAIEADDLASLRSMLSQHLAENPQAFRLGGLGDALGRALELSRYDLADELFKRGATWNYSTMGDVLAGAREDNDWNTKAIDVAVANGWNINEHYEHVGCALVYTIGSISHVGDTVCLKLADHLLSKGALPDEGMQTSQNPLELACGAPDKNMVALLLARGATLERAPKALLAAARRGSVEVMQMLLDRGADVNIHPYGKYTLNMYVKSEGWGSALHCAVKGGHVDAVRFLLDKGADREYRNKVGVTPLELAKKLGWDEIVRLLES